MKFTIEKDVFLKCLSKLQGIVEKRSTMPILSNSLLRVLKGELEVTATDLEVTVLDRCEISSSEPGSITLSAKKLYEIVRELPEGPLELRSKEDNWVEIKSGKNLFELVGLGSEEFPKVPEISQYSLMELDAAVLKQMVEKTIYASAGEESRYSLNGIFLEKSEDKKGLRMAATDGHRLAVIDREIEPAAKMQLEKGVILPRKGMAEVKKILEGVDGKVQFGIKDNSAAVKTNATVVFMRLIDGEFPEYRRVIPEPGERKKKVSIAREDFQRTLRRASLLVDERARAVKFSLSSNLLVMEGKNPGLGTSHGECEVEYKGDKVEIGFNDRYFMDILAVTSSDKIKLEIKDELSPVMVLPDDDSRYFCIVMPMRL
jgi:DNA polymerase-3 subunit beta